MEVKKIISKIIEISQEKKEFLLKIKKITENQRGAIEKGNLNLLMDYIQEKSELMEKINALDLEFLAKFTKIKELLNVSSIDDVDSKIYPELHDLKVITTSIMNLLEEVKYLDDKNNLSFRHDFEDLKSSMKTFSHNVKANKGYKDLSYSNHSQGVFIDNKK